VQDVEKFRDVLLEKGLAPRPRLALRACRWRGAQRSGLGAARRTVSAIPVFPRARPLYNPPSIRLVSRGRRMSEDRPLTILCVSSYEKGHEFIRTCKAIVLPCPSLTLETLRHAAWPFECIDEVFTMPEELPLQNLLYAVSYVPGRSH